LSKKTAVAQTAIDGKMMRLDDAGRAFAKWPDSGLTADASSSSTDVGGDHTVADPPHSIE
jgi:hypothetical protein